MPKSPYQLVNRGRKGKSSWCVEKEGQYCYSDRSKSIAEGYLKMMRRLDRKANDPPMNNGATKPDDAGGAGK